MTVRNCSNLEGSSHTSIIVGDHLCVARRPSRRTRRGAAAVDDVAGCGGVLDVLPSVSSASRRCSLVRQRWVSRTAG